MRRKKKGVVNESMKKTKTKKNGKILLLAVLLILIAGAGITTAYRIGRQTSTESSNGIVVEENVSDWNQDLANLSQNQDSGIKIPGYGELSVGAGDTDWKITLANPKDNNCYFKYSITINDDETPIYESDYIEPGKAVTEFKVVLDFVFVLAFVLALVFLFVFVFEFVFAFLSVFTVFEFSVSSCM